MNRLNITKTGNIVGFLSIVFFLICIASIPAFADPILKELHVNILRIAYPGFSVSFAGVIIGIVDAFIYGWIIGALFYWLCKKICVSNKDKAD